MGDVILLQTQTINTQNTLIAEEQGKRREVERWLVDLERRMDPRGRTFGNWIIIEDNPDEVTLVKGPRVVRELILWDDK